MTLQLFIKLPFLKIESDVNQFVGLKEKIAQELGQNDETFLNWALANENRISRIDFLREGSDNDIEEILREFPNE